MLHDHDRPAPARCTPRIAAGRCAGIDCTTSLPTPVRLNTVSVMIAPPSSAAEVEADHRDERRQAGPQAVLADHPALGEALGARRADVVLAHRLDQVAAGHAGVERREQEREHDPGHDHVEEPVLEAVGDGHVPGPGQPPELVPEDVEHTRPSQKTGAETPNSAKPIAIRSAADAVLQRRQDPDRDADESHTIAPPMASCAVTDARRKICS